MPDHHEQSTSPLSPAPPLDPIMSSRAKRGDTVGKQEESQRKQFFFEKKNQKTSAHFYPAAQLIEPSSHS